MSTASAEKERVDQIVVSIQSMMAGGIHRMSHVYRYSSVPVIRRENVAEHSWYVAFYSWILAQDLERRGYKIDYGKLLSRALVHDLDESMTGDFLRHVKYGHPDLKRALDEVSVSMLCKMEQDLGISIRPMWESAKADDLEGEIIEVVDLGRVISYVLEEMKLGNTHVSGIIQECCNYIEKFVEEKPDSPVAVYAQAIVEYALRGRHETAD